MYSDFVTAYSHSCQVDHLITLPQTFRIPSGKRVTLKVHGLALALPQLFKQTAARYLVLVYVLYLTHGNGDTRLGWEYLSCQPAASS